MKLTELLPLEKWVELEREIQEQSGLSTSIFNTSGIRITDFHKWPNRLCPVIKANDKGQSFICAVAHMNLAEQSRQTREPVVEECDAGLVKLVVPIFVGEEFLGALGACGLLLDGGEVDTFLVNKITDIPEEEVETLSTDIGAIPISKAESLKSFVSSKIENIVKEYKNGR